MHGNGGQVDNPACQLTDVVERAYQDGKPAVLLEINDTIQVIGVNTREELAKAERFVQQGHKGRGPKSS